MGFISSPGGFPGGSASEESTCSAGDLSSIPGLGRSCGEGNGYPLQYSLLENPMDKGVYWGFSPWSCRVRHNGGTNKQEVLGASLLAQQVKNLLQCRRHRRHEFDPWDGEILWSRKWQPTSVFLPEKSHSQRSLVGYSPGGCT